MKRGTEVSFVRDGQTYHGTVLAEGRRNCLILSKDRRTYWDVPLEHVTIHAQDQEAA